MVKQRMMAGVMAALLLASCVENPATGGSSLSLVSKAQEREVGQATAEAALKQYGLYKPSSTTTRYVTSLCDKMVAVTEANNEPTSCILLDSDQFNAWATPGYVNVYRGLLPFVQSEAELAAVLGHEGGHNAARHVAQGMTSQVVAGVLVSALGIYLGTQMDDRAAQAATQLGGLAAGLSLAKFGRDHEHEADALAQRYLPRAGYDAREAVGMVQSMRAYEQYAQALAYGLRGQDAAGENLLGRLTSSHPATPERIAAAAQRAGYPDGSLQLPEGVAPATPANDPQGRNRFLNAMEGLSFGPQRAWGIAGRNYIALPAARTVVRIPEGFVTNYMEGSEKPEAGQWWGRHPASDVRFKMGTDTYKAGMNVGVLLEKLGVDSAQRLQLADGTTAYTGVKSGMNGTFRAVAIPSVGTDKVVMMVFSFPDAATQAREEPAIMQSIALSKVVTETVADRWQPLKLSIRTVRGGDTAERLAAAMPMGALQVELFNALNRVAPNQPLTPGERVKVVVDGNGV
ncbi:MAG: M48 family metalloprotease [Alphaproteobacteria bacterium]